MGGVNFTRNRAWWHTAMWDEYGQRHQYISTFPTLFLLMPLYWYGAGANRNIEQNYAAKMYALDYENRRNRLTHNMIMEHFEMHVEKVQDIFDQIKEEGFEKTFEYELNNPQPKIIPMRHEYGPVNNELKAELMEFSGWTQGVDELKEHKDLPYWLRQELEQQVVRRKHPGTPYKLLPKHNFDLHRRQIMNHYYVDPFEKYTPKEQSE
jgi:hypothetical protein